MIEKQAMIKLLKRTLEAEDEVAIISKEIQTTRMPYPIQATKIIRMKELMEESQLIRKGLIKDLEGI